MAALKFDKIHLNLKQELGQIRIIPSGLGWKAVNSDKIVTIPSQDITKMLWLHAARGYELRLHLKNKTTVTFDGFVREDFDTLKDFSKSNYSQDLIRKEHSLRGYNWGATEFSSTHLSFNVDKKQAFEIPLTEVANTSLASKNEVSLEFLSAEAAADSATPRRKGERQPDQLVEMRFYIPGTVTDKTKKAKLEDGEEANGDDAGDEEAGDGEGDSDAEVQSAAAAFHDLVKSRADIGQVSGGELVLFQEILCLTPRGRFDVEMFDKFFRLRGKTIDYKVMYSSIVKLFSLKKPDDVHGLFVIALDPPLRQGQTRYPFLVLQFPLEDDIDVTLSMEEAELKATFGDKVKQSYEGRAFDVIGNVFSALTKRALVEGADDYHSHHSQQAIKCYMKANEGYLYPLEKCFLFIPKPPTFISYSDISSVVFARVSSAAGSRMFDIKINMLNGTDFQLSNIHKEEFTSFKSFLKLKKLKTIDEQEDGPGQVGYSELSDDEDVPAARIMDDEDEESPDEDFVAESDSDVAEEFNEDYSGGSSSSSEEDDSDAGSGEENGDDAEGPPSKKAKV